MLCDLRSVHNDTPPSAKWAVVSPFFTINPTTKTGTNYTYLYSDAGALYLRSNSGTVMADTLPGTGTGVLPAGQSVVIGNSDSSAMLTVQAGSGTTINGSSGFIYISPGHRITFVSDGSNYWTATQQGRLHLKGSTTFFVATTGNDSTNSGLTASSPWATIQNAISFIQQNVDLNGNTATISVANGTYTSPITASAPFTGSGTVQITGNTTTPTSCIISTTGATAITAQNDAQISLAGLDVTTANFNGIQAQFGGQITINGNMNLGSCAGAQIGATACGLVIVNSNYTITGNSGWHWLAEDDAVITASSLTITLSGTPAFGSAFAQADTAATISCPANTFSGNATGSRFTAKNNGTIFTNGANGTYLPGNSSGTGTNSGTSPYGLYA